MTFVLTEAGAAAAAKPGGRGPRWTLRQSLWWLMVLALLPLAFGGGFVLWQQRAAQHRAVQQGLHDTAQALVAAGESELVGGRALLEALAASPWVDAGDWAGLQRHAAEVARNRPGSLISVADSSGQLLFNTLSPWGTRLPNLWQLLREQRQAQWQGRSLPEGSQALTKRVFETGLAAYSDLYYSPSLGRPAVGLSVPVVRGGRILAALSMALQPEALSQFLGEADSLDRMRLTLLDRSGRVLATNAPTVWSTADVLPEAFMDRARQRPSGLFEELTPDGVPVVGAYAVSDLSGWTVRVAMPRSEAFAGADRAGYAWIAVFVAALTAGLGLASLLARRLSAPLAELAAAADALQHGREPQVSRSTVHEIDALRRALQRAAQWQRDHEQEQRRRRDAEAREAAVSQAAQVLSESRERLRRVIDRLYAGVALLDLDGTLLEINQAPVQEAGLRREDVIGRPFWECRWWSHDDAAQQRLRRAIATAGGGTAVRYDVPVRMAGERHVTIDFQIAPLCDEDGRILHLVASGVDVTARLATEAALRESERALRQADRQKDEFLATLAHELRNPLAPIRSAAQVIRLRRPADAAVVKAGEMIERQSAHMARLVDDLLEVSRITLGHIELQWHTEPLAAIVHGALEAARPALDARQQQLELELPDEPLPLRADATRLSQALLNVLNNAVKFTPPGGRIALAVRREGDGICLTVRDEGVGIAPGMQERIFDMFVQERRPAAQAGLGIGLALARRLVEMHGGTIAAASEGFGTGSTFTIRLPLAVPGGPPPSPAQAVPAAPAADAAAPPRVLVVDDNVDAAEALKMVLELHGHEVRMAHDGASALAAVAEWGPPVVVLDLGLPDLDGCEVARRLRAQHGADGPLLVALTGWGQAADRQRAREAGFDRHFTKPVDPQALLEVLSRVPGEARTA